ncbi:AmiS/UreI family transporter [Pseudazoarcus pumilus]|uniref:Transporter n=1 Tax=Pseudazoarcus pumilus TaxID=2067960 RepID=A0A2I6S391_9RHOO|nr:AmiS/UreI family transporter [Pseudazoarcus pumilus]AUN93687.1 transporter [Pseudazoarcus pumilus]|tara:strand:- start:133 stop:645 length:513 start_codon:yes stop_codon:yes gene_type:complete
MLLGLALLYVGAVLFLNGLWLLGRIGDREIAVINIFVGGLTLLVALYLAFFENDPESIRAAALTLLFTFTYLWVAMNRFNGADGRGLGWFSLFVAITLIPVTIGAFVEAGSVLGMWLAFCWAAWTFLWFLFFLLLGVQKPIVRFTGQVTVVTGILTGWVPGFLMLDGILV